MTQVSKSDDSHEVLKDMSQAHEEQPGENPAEDQKGVGEGADAATDEKR